MSEKYYSTLTNDLAKQYRLALAKRLTNYTPEYRSEYSQLKILTSKESNDNLNVSCLYWCNLVIRNFRYFRI